MWSFPAAGERPVLFGILNLTPDSFSDGGRFAGPAEALAHGLRMAREGAQVIDVGGESTRPGAERLAAREQIRRTGAVIRRLREQLPAEVAISIDTSLADVARAALEAGAVIINDISAGRDDPELFRLAATARCPLVLMHMRGEPKTMNAQAVYADVRTEVRAFLQERGRAAQAAGVRAENIAIDPGIGFGKRRAHNLALLADLPRLAGLGYPVLLGTSRKRFMGDICGRAEPRELVPATCATTALGVLAGVRMFRVHDVKENRQAADVAWAIRRAGAAGA